MIISNQDEYKLINEKEIWIVMKTYLSGKQDFIGAYWSEELAKRVAANNLPKEPNFIISVATVILHGSMIDKA